MENRRFINNILPRLQDADRNPLFDYEQLPLLTLEEATENLSNRVPGVMAYVSTAKQNCRRDLTLLTWDESAAIYLYTMPIPFFSIFNTALRDPNRQPHRPWIPFLKLLITALERLPSTKATLWRGVAYDATTSFVDNSIYTWWSVTSCTMNVNRVQAYLHESGTLFAIETAHGKDISMLSAVPDECEVVLMPATRVRARHQPLNIVDRFFVIHLEEISAQNESNHIFEQIKEEYRRNGRIELFINPAISFPLEQCYINLSIVENKEQQAKEKLLEHAQHSASVIGAYEEIYAVKTPVDVRDMFKTCITPEKQVLVFGRAGIGKSTFCRHVAYQWAIGSCWAHYELLALIPLRQLTTDRYPSGREYSLIDVVKKELFSLDLTTKEDEELTQQFDAKKTLWILDGYDEIVQTTPPHLQTLLAKLLKTPHHIITSRPYLNTLSYQVQMEIVGFTDENIENYVHNFFHRMQEEEEEALLKSERLMESLKSNASFWGVAHVPVNLELVCSLWSDQDWSETQQLTITRLYSMMTEWLCRRYLKNQGVSIQQLSTTDVHEQCEEELRFVETLAFHAMKSNTILLRPTLLKAAMKATKISRQKYLQTLNMGILKSVSKQGISTQVETNKDHYFLHLSFQEYFAARYLSNALQKSQTDESSEFIRQQKYNQRYTLLLSFTAGLLGENGNESCLNLFWDIVLGPPVDLIGIRHMQLVITCMEEINDILMFCRRTVLLEWIIQCIQCSFDEHDRIIRDHISQSLQRSQCIASGVALANLFIGYLDGDNIQRKNTVLSFIGELNIQKPTNALIASVVSRFHEGVAVDRGSVSSVLQNVCERAATNEVISKLVSVLDDQSEQVRNSACSALGIVGRKAATNEVISKLVSAVDDQSEQVRSTACSALGSLREKAATNEVISKFVSALDDQSEEVRSNASFVLGSLGEKALTNEVISKLVSALDDQSEVVRVSAYFVLGSLGEKAAANEVISKLVSALDDQSELIRSNAFFVLESLGEKAAANEVISKLVSALDDQSEQVRSSACDVLRSLGEKAATNEVISKLVSVLDDQSEKVRSSAYSALGIVGRKAATNEMISKLMSALDDQSEEVRSSACSGLGSLCEKAATNEVISKLVSALDDQSKQVIDSACFALGILGEKATTNEIFSKVLSLVDRNKLNADRCVSILRNNLSSSKVMKQIDPFGTVQFLQKHNLYYCLKNVAVQDVFSMLRDTKDAGWLSLLIEVVFVKGSAVIAEEDKLIVYDNREPYELFIGNQELFEELIKTFTNRAERSHLRLQI